MRRTAIATVLVAAVAVAGLTQLSRSDETAAPDGARVAALPPADFPDPGLVHVHGLGVDPADGTLYAATHSGLFAVPEQGEARRIANRYQDTMGFTVTGPGTFLGSGHPDPREDDVRPPLLGLIESTDGGQSWERLSLHGEADFHAVQAAHGRVYGYDATSGTFMVSTDKQRWDRRAQLPLRSFAVDPADPDVVLAATPQGLARSRDGGRSWQRVPAAPAVAVLAWPAAGSLYGVAADGSVVRSADGGGGWTVRGHVGGEPEAMTVVADDAGESVYVAAAGRGILVSRDGGGTFTTRYGTH